MIVASIRIAVASPTPNCLKNSSESRPKIAKTPTITTAALVTTPAADYVSDLKQQPGGDIGIHGSIDLASSLLRAGLVDVLELAVAPATAGRGRRVFESDDASQRWDLANVERSPLGTLFLTYRSADADAVPAEDPTAG